MKFSVLISIYYKERASYFNRCMQSIWDEQSIKPNEIVLVEDGELTLELYDLIDKWEQKLNGILIRLQLDTNVGLGDALNIGLHSCNFELIARMDSDDIARRDRFEKQLKILQNGVDICSSWVSEFDIDEREIISYRRVPELHKDILIFSKSRNPLNHPAVMYKKSKVLDAGGYKKMLWFEDYYLWIRVLLSGAKFYNIQEPLVNMRSGFAQLERRSGLSYAKAEFKFQKELLNLEFITVFRFIKNLLVRLIVRISPKKAVKIVYKLIRR